MYLMTVSLLMLAETSLASLPYKAQSEWIFEMF